MSGGAIDRLLGRAWSDLGRNPDEFAAAAGLPETPLPARLDVSALAVGSVAAVSLAAAGMHERMPRLQLDGDGIATAFTSERAFTIDGTRPAAWAPLSGFWRARDAWVRTHGNYPHHAAALRHVLGLGDDADAAAAGAAIAQREASALARDVSAVGGMCVEVAPEDPSSDARRAETPLIDVRRIADAAPHRRVGIPGPERPLAGIRVLDLTRVIASPVATRTLALLGARVLRVDPPRPAEIGWQHLDTGAGKRSTILDLGEEADSARFDELLSSADVVVLGYRPDSLARLGLSPAALAQRHPGLVIAQLSAWGFDDADAGRGGFDSLVQASSGIALVEGDADAPGALPAQALDHATGYLLAAAVITLLERQAKAGGSWSVRMSLRRTAAELLTMPRTAEPSPARALDDVTRESHLTTLVIRGGTVRLPLPAIAFAGGPTGWPEAPHPWGSDAAEFPE